MINNLLRVSFPLLTLVTKLSPQALEFRRYPKRISCWLAQSTLQQSSVAQCIFSFAQTNISAIIIHFHGYNIHMRLTLSSYVYKHHLRGLNIML